VLDHSKIDVACKWLSAKAQEHYKAANAVLKKRPAGRLRAPRLMSAVYHTLLNRMQKAGWKAPRERFSLSKAELTWIVATRGLGR
jgi:phytoene synthase